VASSTSEQLANPFLFCAEWQVLQMNNRQAPFIFHCVPSGKFYKRTACTYLSFSPSVIPSVAGLEMSPIISISNNMFSIEQFANTF